MRERERKKERERERERVSETHTHTHTQREREREREWEWEWVREREREREREKKKKRNETMKVKDKRKRGSILTHSLTDDSLVLPIIFSPEARPRRTELLAEETFWLLLLNPINEWINITNINYINKKLELGGKSWLWHGVGILLLQLMTRQRYRNKYPSPDRQRWGAVDWLGYDNKLIGEQPRLGERNKRGRH
jgi:hypothetical protein